tara:strand:+ start:326 stop:745 length:420 start_codon:yes stop_codon:yes gene_type:complete
MALQNQEIRTESISESAGGSAIIINADYTTVADVDHLHIMTVADVLDSLYIEIFNSYSTAVNVNLVLNPIDTAVAANVDAVTITVAVPRTGSAWPLQGQRFRVKAGNAYTLAAYVATADIGRLRVTGWVNRIKSSEMTA